MLYNVKVPPKNIGYKINAETMEPERKYAQLQLLKEMVRSVSAALPAF